MYLRDIQDVVDYSSCSPTIRVVNRILGCLACIACNIGCCSALFGPIEFHAFTFDYNILNA